MAQTNNEVKETLLELCRVLQKIIGDGRHQTEAPKKYIMDQPTQKIRGCQTRSTSSKVNHTSVPPSTRMVDAFQVNVLRRSQRGTDKRPKRHKCPVCQVEGHHGRTCRNILLHENAERADAFLKDLFEKTNDRLVYFVACKTTTSLVCSGRAQQNPKALRGSQRVRPLSVMG